MEIRVLKYFLMAAREENITKAAELLHITQPKGVVSPIIGATKASYFDDAAGALDVKLTAEDIAYLEEPYLPHRIVGAIASNPADGVILLDEKK